MHLGNTLTRASVWLAISCYAAARGLMLAWPARINLVTVARSAWTLGGIFFLAHVACAFTFYHHWSHSAAFEETAAQTRDLIGIRWGGGLYFNYVFAAAWTIDTLWWWLDPAGRAGRSWRITAVWHSFFFFMVFNGTVVFGRGPVRWFGVLICGSLAVLWLVRRKAIVDLNETAP